MENDGYVFEQEQHRNELKTIEREKGQNFFNKSNFMMQENVGIDVLKNFQLYFVYETVELSKTN